MKKILFISLLTLSFANMFAQSELTVVRGETMNGKKIRVDYYKGKSSDLIERIEYEVVDELNAKIKEYQNKINEYSKTIENLKKDKHTSENTIADLNTRISALNDSLAIMENKCNQHLANLIKCETQIKTMQAANDSITEQPYDNDEHFVAVIDSLSQLNHQLRLQIEKYDKDLSNFGNDMKLSTATHSIGVDLGIGLTLFNNSNLKNDFWSKETLTNQHLSVYFQTKRLLKNFPLSVGLGIGFDNMSMKAHFNYYSETINNLTDNDGDRYNLTRDYSDVSEKISLSYISIPLFVAIGQPYSNNISVYGKLALVPMLNVSNSITASGTYTSTGYYPQWDVTLHDIPELGFNTDAQCYNDNMDLNVNSFILAGSLSAGVYYPLCNINKNNQSSSFVLKGGICLNYTLMSVSGTGSNDDISDAKYKLGTYNSIEDTKVFSPIIEIGLIYLIKK